MKRKRAEESLDAHSEVLENKRALRREYMKNKRAKERLDANSEALEKKRALNKEYMNRKRVEESLDANSEVLENKCTLKREYMKNKRAKENLNAKSGALEKKRALNKEYMKRKRAEESLDENSETLEKKRALNKEYMKKKRAKESLDANSEVLENKRALKREYMKNKRANESLDANAEVLEKKREINKKYMKNKRSLGHIHNSEPCNSNNKRVCRENEIIHEHSIGQNNELQKSSGPSDNSLRTVLNVPLTENLKVSKHNETTIKNFVKELPNYPEYTCIICKMLFFNHQVSEVTNDGNKKSYICKSVCQKHFFKNDYSNTAERNFLYTGDLPENLCDINPTECRLIAQIFLFMKIKLLPAGGQ